MTNEQAIESLNRVSAAKRSPSARDEGLISRALGERKGQVGHYVATYRVGAHRFRVELRKDSVVDQSFGKISRWSGSAWEMVHTLDARAVQTPHNGYAPSGFREDDFAADEAELLRVALIVVGA